jgi:hypothetical protein
VVPTEFAPPATRRGRLAPRLPARRTATSEAGADEVIFSFAFADTAGITAVGEALGLGGH